MHARSRFHRLFACQSQVPAVVQAFSVNMRYAFVASEMGEFRELLSQSTEQLGVDTALEAKPR
ncbi:MAG: hypothetical protein CMQ49_14615 [Gammaproteobacteria bacterium]|nr:hypothetical protein [Gammaproteobacteria bacterium]